MSEELKPLTSEEQNWLASHLLVNDSVEEIEKDTVWHQKLLDNMSESDPARRRFERIVEDNTKVLDFKKRLAAMYDGAKSLGDEPGLEVMVGKTTSVETMEKKDV